MLSFRGKNEPIPGKHTDRQKDKQKDRQNLFYMTLLAEAGGPKLSLNDVRVMHSTHLQIV